MQLAGWVVHVAELHHLVDEHDDGEDDDDDDDDDKQCWSGRKAPTW